MKPDVDVLILGGGCAGLSLAWKLAKTGSACPRVMVLEQRKTYTNDRTWCFWDNKDADVAGLISHQWHGLKLSAQQQTVYVDCAGSPYQMLAASTFYDHVLGVIADCAAITVALNENVMAEPELSAIGWTVVTNRRKVTARHVVDTRPARVPSANDAVLWQSFHGHEVRCVDDVFTPGTPDLMAFTLGCPEQIEFTYVLPMSPRRALIEATVFGPKPLAAAAMAVQLSHAVARHTAQSPFTLLRSESGVLPMGLKRVAASSGPGYVRVGVMAGGARASSGFAFQRIQKWASACSAAIASGRSLVGHRADPLLVQTMDRLFLHVLRQSPGVAPALFLSLFEQADTPSLIRFLSGNGTVKDCLQVINALPAKRFLQQLLPRTQPAVPDRASP